MKSITKPAGKPVIGLLAVLAALAFLLTGCPESGGEETKYTVTFNSNGGSPVESQTVVDGGKVSEPAGVTKPDYALAGWYKDAAFLTPWNFDNAVTSNLTLYAKWTGVSYRITYNLNDGTQGANPPNSYSIESPDIALPEPAKAGYDFGGWYANEDFTGDAVTQIPARSTGDKTFWAKWTLLSYQIIYKLNGGTEGVNPPSSYTVESEAVNLPEPAKTGYDFGGWYANEDFTGAAAAQIPTGSTGDKTFWAKWTVLSYRITYNLNGGTQGANPPNSYSIESPDIALPEPAKAGNIFSGWYAEADFTGAAAAQIPAGSTGDKTFWAKWSPLGAAGITIQYWINEQGHIAFSNGTSTTITSTSGQSVVIAASGTGYAGQKWYINGTEDASKAGQASFTFTRAGKAPGRYAVGLQVSKDGAYYYAEFIVTVTN